MGEAVQANFSVVSRGSGRDTSVLMLEDPGGWVLPTHDHLDPGAANDEIRRRFGVTVTTLSVERAPGIGVGRSRVFVHETHHVGPGLPAGSRWVPAGSAATAAPAHQAVLHSWRFEHLGGGHAGYRLPWRRRGWFDQAAAWTLREVRRAGVRPTGPVEQFHFRAWSAQLRVPTTDGWVYFKATPPAFGHEAALTTRLARWCPGQVPDVLAHDPARHWMLTAGFGTVPHPARSGAGPATFAAVAAAAARVQRAAAPHADELAAHGVPDHRPGVLPALYDELLDRLAGSPAELSASELQRLRDFAPRFASHCARLSASEIPASVVHLDLWRGNFLDRGAEGPLLFDWAESVLGHPFAQVAILLEDAPRAAPPGAPVARRVTGAYASAWAGSRGAGRRLHAAARLARAPGIVSRALLMRDAVAGLDPRDRTPYTGAVGAPLLRLLTPGDY